MYISNYKVKLKKDTSYKGLWIVSFTLNVYTHMGLDDAEKEMQKERKKWEFRIKTISL